MGGAILPSLWQDLKIFIKINKLYKNQKKLKKSLKRRLTGGAG
jgi:hypothetical protein